jgi:predicted dithiol-disulfide oxidoreductase (DUF899 family)
MQTELRPPEQIDREIDALNQQILDIKQKIRDLRGRRALEPVGSYEFRDWSGNRVSLADLFGDKNDLIVIHNMGPGCRYCTLWADGFNGEVDHLQDRAAFVVISHESPEAQRKFAESRGWRFRMVSAAGTAFFADMGFGNEESPYPGVSAFRRKDDGIYRTGRAELGEGDEFCAVWNLFDLLKDGWNGWEPQDRYS